MEQTQTKKKIMWVEDDPFLRDILAHKIVTSGYELIHFSTADEALAALTTTNPDLLLLDILLPRMNGFEFLEKVRAMPEGKNIAVVFLSNYGQKEDIERATSLGAKKFILKASATPEEIMGVIQQAIA